MRTILLCVLIFSSSVHIPVQKEFRTERNEEEAQYIINKIYKRLINRVTNFCQEAMAYSDDLESRTRCGERGWKEAGSLCREYEEMACGMEPGDISPPFKSTEGYHIMQLLEKRAYGINTRHILITYEEEF